MRFIVIELLETIDQVRIQILKFSIFFDHFIRKPYCGGGGYRSFWAFWAHIIIFGQNVISDARKQVFETFMMYYYYRKHKTESKTYLPQPKLVLGRQYVIFTKNHRFQSKTYPFSGQVPQLQEDWYLSVFNIFLSELKENDRMSM